MAAETHPFKAAYPAAPVPEVDSQIAHAYTQLCAEGDVFSTLICLIASYQKDKPWILLFFPVLSFTTAGRTTIKTQSHH